MKHDPMRPPALPATDAASARAYDFTKWAILSGVYAGGELVTESRLAHETGVGRGPVREALLRLEVEGLVRRVPRQGALVAEFSVRDVHDVLEARELVESHTAARSFAVRQELLPRVEVVHQEMRKARREHDTAAFTAADREFHEAIVDAAGNAVLSHIYRTLRERQTLFTSAIMRGRADRMDAAIEEHERLLETLRGDDEEAFCAAVRAHLHWSVAMARESMP